jgi:predicted patatin/cPLA2 family phospholipase
MTKEEKTEYNRAYRNRPGMKEKLNNYYRMYRMLNKEVIQKSNSERYYKRKLNKLNNDQSNEISATEQ